MKMPLKDWIHGPTSSVLSGRLHLSVKPILLITILCCYIKYGESQRNWETWSRWEPPWDKFDNSLIARTYFGDVRGFSVPWHAEDEAWNPEWDDAPKWYVQRVNCWLGIPYAEPPLGPLRFQRPRRPRWADTWDASYFRNSCPQDIRYIRNDIPDYPRRNISEDCLYLNIFAPNITWHSRETLYPVVVFIHGGEFLYGTSQIYPGHVLAKQEIVVVTMNYRLGALGFLTTEDEHGPGNWGLWDQQLALEFVRENIKQFKGDPKQITLMGDGAGAASAGIHIISPVSRNKNLFHKAILMSGSDMSGAAIVEPFWRPQEYAYRLGKILHCKTTDDSHNLLQCLRKDLTRPWQDFVKAQAEIDPNDGELGMVWGPVQDGGYYNTYSYLPETPIDLRRQQTFAKIPVIVGINQHDGSLKANRTIRGLNAGMFEGTLENFLSRQLQSWKVMNRYWQRAKEAVEFQYTYWPDPENRTARAQEFINLITDLDYGKGIDDVIKFHAPYESSYQYVWSYKSNEDYLPHWMGASRFSQIPFVFGYPFMNETILNETELVMKQWYDWEDRNMSDCTMILWTNFIKFTVPTPNVTCNVTWDPYQEQNLTYLILDFHKHMWFRYRQSQYGFWQTYFPTIALQDYLRPTATPTPAGFHYVYATGSMAAVFIVSLIVVGICIYLLVDQARRQEEEEYPESQMSFGASRSQSNITMTTRDRQSPEQYAMPYGQHYLSHGQSHSEI